MRTFRNASFLALAGLALALYLGAPHREAAHAGEGDGAPPPAEDEHRAPLFELVDIHGLRHRLEAYRGRWVVLEWTNLACPFVRKHYHPSRQSMQALQQRYGEKGVVWLTICSSAEGKQGWMTPEAWREAVREAKAHPHAVLLDADGTVGRLYGARTTPEIRVIDPEGRIRYQGAVDDKPSTRPEDLDEARCYVSLVLDAALAGTEIPVTSTRSYGCSVKYAN